MKKSIFIRYISTFLLIIFISFFVLTLIITSMTIRSENKQKQEIAENTSIYITEYLVSEFNPTDVDRLNFTFKIKATYPCDSPEYFVFKIKCPYDKEMVEKKFPYPENVNCNFDEEYFFTIKDLLYINDHNGMTIGGFEDLYRRESNICDIETGRKR